LDMAEKFTVKDLATGRMHYESDSLCDAYDIWTWSALIHVSYVRDLTETDCGGGVTLDRDDGTNQPVRLYDSSCGGRWCTNCSPE
jgi:hypothetical protein